MTEHQPLLISWSGLKRYMQCHQRHKLVITGKSPPTKDIRIFLPGTVADRVMRRWLEGETDPDSGEWLNPQPGQMAGWVDEMFHHYATNSEEGVVRWRGHNDYAVTRNFVRELVTDLEKILNYLVLPYDYEPEHRFETLIGIPYLDGHIVPVKLVGGMDIVVRESIGAGEYEYDIWDLKATANNDYWRETVGQLIFYELSLMAELGLTKPPRRTGLIQPKCDEPVINVRITDDDRNVMMNQIIAMAHGIWRKDWSTNKGSHCSMCEVKHACPAFTVTDVTDEQGRRRASFGTKQPSKAASG